MPMRAAMILGLFLVACTGPAPPTSVPTPPSDAAKPADALWQAYERAVREAAVRTPASVVPLEPLPAGTRRVTVATFTEYPPPGNPLGRLTWVALPEQLRRLCRGRADSVLAIQQALGLPPQAAPSKQENAWKVVLLDVSRGALRRPCPGGFDEGSVRCREEASRQPFDRATANFLVEQMWTAWRVGAARQEGDGRILGTPGYPFTGMGWTWNWDPSAASPVGVSEFVVQAGTAVSGVRTMTPEAFCKAGSG